MWKKNKNDGNQLLFWVYNFKSYVISLFKTIYNNFDCVYNRERQQQQKIHRHLLNFLCYAKQSSPLE